MPTLPLVAGGGPRISFVVVVYDMPEQAGRTLYSLSLEYQRGVRTEDYEVIVVENDSENSLGAEAATAYSGNYRYFLRTEQTHSPVPALNFGAKHAKASHVAYMIDGARLLSPGVINYMLAGIGLATHVAVSVPGYHLGYKIQQEAMLEGYDQAAEARLMASIDWPVDGYRLFEIACLAGTSRDGFFKPVGESNCFCLPRIVIEQLGGFDERFDETGGGLVNLDFYKRAVELDDITLVTLLGEGSFHQFHGGATTGTKGVERRDALEAHLALYSALRGGPFEPPERRSVYLGTFPDSALGFIRHSAEQVIELNGLDRPINEP